MTNIATVAAFCEAWKSRDPDAIAALMSEDCFYHNVPMAPVIGRAAIAEFIRGFMGDAKSAEFEILAIAEAADGTVLTERIDRFEMTAGTVALPVMGSFRIKDGLIHRWLDYFDMTHFAPQPAE